MNPSLISIRLRTLSALLFAAFVVVTTASAQTGIYVEYGGSKVDTPTDNWIYGPTFGLYHDFFSAPGRRYPRLRPGCHEYNNPEQR